MSILRMSRLKMNKLILAMGLLLMFTIGIASAEECALRCPDFDGDGVVDKDDSDIYYFSDSQNSKYDINADGIKSIVSDLACFVQYINKSRHEIPACVVPDFDKCTDSDGGIDIYEKGKTSGHLGPDVDEFGYKYDFCVRLSGSASELKSCEGDNCGVYEFNCMSNEHFPVPFVNGNIEPCPYGCKDGACIKELEISCFENDQGKDYYNKGKTTWTVGGVTATKEDSCEITSSSKNQLLEWYCDKEKNMGLPVYYDCPYGCRDGACIESQECIPEGKRGSIFNDDVCCGGLEKIGNSFPEGNLCIAPTDGSFICSDCGDNVCDSWENTCNCPEDCKTADTCVDKCGDGICQEVVCLGTGCPCPETPQNCPRDCAEETCSSSQYVKITKVSNSGGKLKVSYKIGPDNNNVDIGLTQQPYEKIQICKQESGSCGGSSGSSETECSVTTSCKYPTTKGKYAVTATDTKCGVSSKYTFEGDGYCGDGICTPDEDIIVCEAVECSCQAGTECICPPSNCRKVCPEDCGDVEGADLKVESITTSENEIQTKEGLREISFTARIKNIGKAKSDKFSVEEYLDNVRYNSWDFQGLEPGYAIPIQTSGAFLKPGWHTVKFTIIPHGPDADKYNNELSHTFYVSVEDDVCNNADISGTVKKGTQRTYTANGRTYIISVLAISDNKAKLLVNNEVTTSLAVGEKYQLEDETVVKISKIGSDSVGFCLFIPKGYCGDGICTPEEDMTICEEMACECEVGGTCQCPPSNIPPTCRKVCPEDCEDNDQEITEQVTCVFHDTGYPQKCYSDKGDSCEAIPIKCMPDMRCPEFPSCTVNVKGNKGERVTWKSTCGGYEYTYMDGRDENADFYCQTFAKDLSDYPDFFFINGKMDGLIVVGDQAPADDVLTAVDIATSLEYYREIQISAPEDIPIVEAEEVRPIAFNSSKIEYAERAESERIAVPPSGISAETGTVEYATIMPAQSVEPIRVEKVKVGKIVLASEVRDPRIYNLILVGNACSNAATAELLGNPSACTDGLKPGTAKIQLMNYNNRNQLLVYGYTAQDTRKAGQVLANWRKYNLQGTEVCIDTTNEPRIISCDEPSEYSCKDTDSGKDYFTQGTVYWEIDNQVDRHTDYCIDQWYLSEGYCDDDQYNREKVYCKNGCSDGVCQQSNEECPWVCDAIGTRSEGWYDSCTGELIKWAKCGTEESCGNLLYFYSENCPHCDRQVSIIKEIDNTYDCLNIEYIDINSNPEYAEKFDVTAVPTMVYLHDTCTEKKIGYTDYKSLNSWLNEGECPIGQPTTPTCYDGIWNDGEEGVDCGGPCKPCDTTTECNNGCIVNNKCLPYGTRLVQDDTAKFCNIDSKMTEQKEEGAICQNNYECSTNTCSSGKCVDLAGQIEENQNAIQKIIRWFSRLFGSDD